MGWAKYMEDDQKLYDDRMFVREVSPISQEDKWDMIRMQYCMQFVNYSELENLNTKTKGLPN